MKNIYLPILMLLTLLSFDAVGQGFPAITEYRTVGGEKSWQDVDSWQAFVKTSNADPGSWQENIAPGNTDIGASGTIYGYVASSLSLSFQQGASLTINPACTLVVIGDLTFLGNNSSINIGEGGILVVSGNLTTDLNNLAVGNNGKVAIGGDLITGTGNTGSVDTSNGDLYVIGDTDTPSTTGTIGDGDALRTDVTFADFVNQVAPAILPVNLLYFTATAQPQSVEIKWAASKAWDFSHYELERSRDGQHFNYIATIDAEENTDYLTEFSYTDLQPVSGTSYYRLKAVDIDGRFEYKQIAVVQFAGTAQLKVFPNPSSTGSFQVAYGGASEGAIVTLKDQAGRTVRTQEISDGQRSISTKGLPAGLYILTVRSAYENAQEQVIIK
ncbi:T9SS type A sorting domain-containing protein [Nafulsella turpanensis]|uniref:T9SS type A sorting domain-containing protein n=1 Tax=Nafulsella turpanensis TaxID=1265690 RepID=UPI000344CD95|nr:T9SS type A sorting domain-containing protein [Nafulsella turpanensis]